MSATTLPRNEVRPDYYPTPPWAARAIMPTIRKRLATRDRMHGSVPRPERWMVLDAGCGDGNILAELRAAMPSAMIEGVDFDATLVASARARGLPATECNFFSLRSGPWHAIAMNPPFSDGLRFVAHAIELVRPHGGFVVALLRLPWLAGACRADFHREHGSDLYVLPKRPDFTGGGGDRTEYAWYVFGGQPGPGGRWTLLDCEGAQ